jgi:DNA repair exonuclease SbcCD ATPase subunit
MTTTVTDENPLGVTNVTTQSDGVQSGTPVNSASDAGETTAQYEERLARMQKDMDRMRSSYDRNAAEREKQWQQQKAELEARLHAVATKDLDEKDRAAYERDLYASRVQEMEQRLVQMEAQRQAEENMRTWAAAYQTAFKIEPTAFDMSTPEAFQQSAWQAVQNKFTAMEQEIAQLRGTGQATTQTTRPAASPKSVVTTQGNVPQKPANDWAVIRERYARATGKTEFTDDDIFNDYERGRFNLS